MPFLVVIPEGNLLWPLPSPFLVVIPEGNLLWSLFSPFLVVIPEGNLLWSLFSFPKGICSDLTHPPIRKFTVIVVSTSVGAPFSSYGEYRAPEIASIAAERSIGGPLTTRRLSTRPAFEITAAATTVPSTCAARAIAGYTGRIGDRSIPAATPEDTRIGPFLIGAGATRTATPDPTPDPTSPNTPGTPVPLPIAIGPIPTTTGAGPSSREIPTGIRGGAVNIRPAVAIADTGFAAVPRASNRTGTGAFGTTNGSTTRGASTPNRIRSGRSKGAITNAAAIPTCNTTDPAQVHRAAADRTPTRDITKLSSNIKSTPKVRHRGRTQREKRPYPLRHRHPRDVPKSPTHNLSSRPKTQSAEA